MIYLSSVALIPIILTNQIHGSVRCVSADAVTATCMFTDVPIDVVRPSPLPS